VGVAHACRAGRHRRREARWHYAAGLLAQLEAAKHGCEQVVFVDAVERRWIEELGGMNIFFVFNDGSMQTRPIGGTILPGITRASIITVAKGIGITVREEPYTFSKWREDAASGRLKETFACGTADADRLRQVRRRQLHDRQRRLERPDQETAHDPGRHPALPRPRPARLGASRVLAVLGLDQAPQNSSSRGQGNLVPNAIFLVRRAPHPLSKRPGSLVLTLAASIKSASDRPRETTYARRS